MTPQQAATLAALREGNEWLIRTLKNNQIMLAEARGEIDLLKIENKRLEQRLRARGKA